MAIPSTYLLTAPSDSDSLFGTGLSSSTMIRKLEKLNPSIWVEENYPLGVWSPGKATGLTCLWYGIHGSKVASKKISGFIPGIIPEFTQLDERGFVMHLGWRRILEKAISRRAVSRVQVEQSFGVTLDIAKNDNDGWCPSCAKKGKHERATGAGNLCNFHTGLNKTVERASMEKRDRKAQLLRRSA